MGSPFYISSLSSPQEKPPLAMEEGESGCVKTVLPPLCPVMGISILETNVFMSHTPVAPVRVIPISQVSQVVSGHAV